jgi:hypothetical protein
MSDIVCFYHCTAAWEEVLYISYMLETVCSCLVMVTAVGIDHFGIVSNRQSPGR